MTILLTTICYNMGWKWFIERKTFDCAAKQLTVTVKFAEYAGNYQLVSEPFGRDEDDIKWQLIFGDSSYPVYLEKIGGESNDSFVVDLPDMPDAVWDNVTGLRTTGKKVQIARWNSDENFDIKITYPDCLIWPVPAKRSVRGKYCDVKFKVGTETIGFYKYLLAGRSDVFDTMFSSPVTDPLKANDPIEIKDASAIGFNAFLDIIHDGLSPEDTDLCLEVLEIAEKYNCEYVKHIISVHLSNSFKEENAIKILLAADQYGFDSLKVTVLKFLREKPAHKLPDAKLLATNPDLMLEVMEVVFESLPTPVGH